MSSYRINICELSLSQLNAQCLIKIKQLVELVEQHDQTLKLDLSDDQIIANLVQVAKKSKDPEVQRLYVSTKDEISKHINSPRFAKHHQGGLAPPTESAMSADSNNEHTRR